MFVFSLQPLLERRELDERAALAAYAAANAAAGAARDRLRALHDRTTASAAFGAAALRDVDAEIARRRADVAHLARAEAPLRERLIAARRDRKAIALLRERRIAEYRAKVRRREARFD